MPLVSCPECKKQISSAATQCPHCGHPLRAASQAVGGMPTIQIGFMRGIEYRSKFKIAGIPLVHVATGFDDNGRKRIARGIIALGDIAIGVLALGGVALGGLSFGGLSLGAIAIGGLAIGGGAVGGCGVGYVAIGGCAIGYYAMGGAAFGAHTVSAMGMDPEAVDFFANKIGGPFKFLKGMHGFTFPTMPNIPSVPQKGK